MGERRYNITETKLSVAVLASTGNFADFISTQVLMVEDRHGKLGPVSGKVDILVDNVPEHPIDAFRREWMEETGCEPFVFRQKPKFLDTIFSLRDGYANIGFIYKAELTDDAIEIFKRGKVVTDDEDIVLARLLNIDDIIEILKNWQVKLAHPEINAQTLIHLTNIVMNNHDNLFMPGVTDCFTADYFGIPFKTSSLSLY